MKNTFFALFILCFSMLFLGCQDDTPQATSIEALLTEMNFSGYATVIENGTPLVDRGFGVANQTSGMPQGTQVVYRVASVSKTLVAAAVVQLKRDGLISSFDQTLNEFDSSFPNGDQISIAQLLSHQSGLPDYQLIVEDAYEQGETLDEEDIYEVVVALVNQNGLNFTPGEGKEYSNSNFLIAALLVQEVSGMPYHTYLQQKILTPLGMTNTNRGTDIIDTQTHAQGYHNGEVNSTYPIMIAFGAGDLSSTPTDMLTWVNAVSGNWFTEAEKDEIFAQNVPSGYVDFGLGWFTTQEGNTTMYWHGGDINGYWSMIGFIPEHNTTIVLLSNHQDDTGMQRGSFIEYLLSVTYNRE